MNVASKRTVFRLSADWTHGYSAPPSPFIPPQVRLPLSALSLRGTPLRFWTRSARQNDVGCPAGQRWGHPGPDSSVASFRSSSSSSSALQLPSSPAPSSPAPSSPMDKRRLLQFAFTAVFILFLLLIVAKFRPRFEAPKPIEPEQLKRTSEGTLSARGFTYKQETAGKVDFTATAEVVTEDPSGVKLLTNPVVTTGTGTKAWGKRGTFNPSGQLHAHLGGRPPLPALGLDGHLHGLPPDPRGGGGLRVPRRPEARGAHGHRRPHALQPPDRARPPGGQGALRPGPQDPGLRRRWTWTCRSTTASWWGPWS